ncbi:oligopeptide ABC transporter permease [Paramaledivibacter caminithermalis]|jgi:peptide/nickel transport system permease protein|uniref:Peptide/nickel transport system permease protein n=1 Tax=Paramaledivibacter caminithermalis (strain DSM 15212 / CIP 107654 / DViRD3) TaxID=1121301 RepID=A0A1M6LIU9_PARC5|nr:oligopeptide ABC transporter permease [Paramaledivibacter caminithermalis]SHJ71097.1 peptide/nickel transport system permease protein [Paramaledivibacter caminithermalis DSM 15212]
MKSEAIKKADAQKKNEEQEVVGLWEMVWANFKKNKLAVFGLIAISILILLVILAPIITPYERDAVDLLNAEQPPSMSHWLGTDELGRDYFTRILYGGRISLKVGLFSVGVSLVLGILFGGVSGFYGGWIDNILMRIAEIIYSFPFLPLAITLSAILGTKVSTENKMYMVMVIIGVLRFPGLARMIRGQILTLREQEFMQAATALGLSDSRKIFRHLIPNTFAYIIVNATLGVAGAIMSESALSFLGLGVVPPIPTWGNMVTYATRSYVLKNMPWLWIPPGFCIFIAVMSINLMGDGLRDAVDPKSNR